MNFSRSDYAFMSQALRLAERGLCTTQPNPRVGCVIVQQNKVVAEGYHQQAGSAHAEIKALQTAGESARGATVYVTLEPCSHHGKTPPCADALINAGVGKVVCAMQDPNPQVSGQGIERLRASGIKVQSGLLEAQAQQLNPGFIKRMKTGLPYVRVKLAMSLDGRTAMASGESQWITGEAARRDVQLMRARSSVVLTGSATVINDNPSMNVRLTSQELALEVEPYQPLRAIIDSALKVSTDSRIFQLAGQTQVFSTQTAPHVTTVSERQGKVDLQEVMTVLAQQQANEVHVEAGSGLCGALLDQQLVDELVVYMAPHIMGDSAQALFHLPNIDSMSQRIALEISDIRPIGKDWRITAVPKYSESRSDHV